MAENTQDREPKLGEFEVRRPIRYGGERIVPGPGAEKRLMDAASAPKASRPNWGRLRARGAIRDGRPAGTAPEATTGRPVAGGATTATPGDLTETNVDDLPAALASVTDANAIRRLAKADSRVTAEKHYTARIAELEGTEGTGTVADASTGAASDDPASPRRGNR